MARKKMTPIEEAEQLQSEESLEETNVQAAETAPSGLPQPEDAAGMADGPPEGECQEDAPPMESPAEAAEGQEMAAKEETTSDGPPPAAPLPDWPDDGAPEWEAPSVPPVTAEETPEPTQVLSVDLSQPVPAPVGGGTPEDLDSLLEDPPAVLPAAPLAQAEDSLPDSTEPPAPPAPGKSDRQKFYELKFNQLDRGLTPEERQEWNSIYASYRGRSALTGTIIGVDPFSVQVRSPETGRMEKQTMYCAIVVPYRVRIVIPASEMWEKDKERPDFVLQNMVGATIDFIIIKVDREAGFAIGSRRLAARSQRYFLAHRPNLGAVGARLKCRMLSVGPRRCLVECYGHDIGLTQRELRYTAIPDLRNEYHPGQELDCVVKLYDPDAGQLEISIKETGSNPFDGAEQRHPVGARRLAMIAGKYGGGVFCNLPDGTVCMCNYSYQHEDADFLVGDHVMLIVQRFDLGKQQMYGKILTKW